MNFWRVLVCGLTFLFSFDVFAIGTSVGTASQVSSKKWCAYLGDWGKVKDTETIKTNLQNVDTLWIRMFQVLPDGHLDLKWKPAGPVDSVMQALKKEKHPPAFGPLFQNSNSSGFSRAYGLEMLKNAEVWTKDLLVLKKKWNFKVFQLDIESMEAGDSALFEKTVQMLSVFAGKNGLKFSMALHAQTEIPSNNEGARFQRWEKLKKIPGRKIIMGLDHAWASGPAGVVAPIDWLLSVTKLAKTFFSEKELVIAMPLYGYHWKKGEIAQSGLCEELKQKVLKDNPNSGWKPDLPQVKENGYLYRKADETIAFDDSQSVLAKRAKLVDAGISSFAFWRVGGDAPELYR